MEKKFVIGEVAEKVAEKVVSVLSEIRNCLFEESDDIDCYEAREDVAIDIDDDYDDDDYDDDDYDDDDYEDDDYDDDDYDDDDYDDDDYEDDDYGDDDYDDDDYDDDDYEDDDYSDDDYDYARGSYHYDEDVDEYFDDYGNRADYVETALAEAWDDAMER